MDKIPGSSGSRLHQQIQRRLMEALAGFESGNTDQIIAEMDWQLLTASIASSFLPALDYECTKIGQRYSTEEKREKDAVELTDFTTADQQCGWTPQSRRRQSLESDILTVDEHDQVNHAIGKVSGLHLSASHMMIGVAIGFVVGIVLSLHDIPPLVVQCLSMPGELFLRALKALIMPYVFCAVAVGISDMINVGKFSKIGWLTIRVFLTFWLSTAALGVGIAIGFRNLFRSNLGQAKTNHVFGFSCAINNQTLQVQTNGSVLCSSDNTTSTGQYAADFLSTDANNQFQKTDMTGETAHMSISQQLMNIPDLFVPSNVIASFANGELVSVITFAMALGAVAGKNFHAKTRRINYLYLVLFQLRIAFFLALEWVICLTPGAAISLIAGSFVRNKEFIDHFDRVYMYGVAILVAGILHVFVVLPFIVFLATRRNPYKHMRSSGLGSEVTALRIVLLFLLSALAAAGTVAIPSGGLTLTVILFKTVFRVEETPATFPFLVAMDFVADRIATICNVHGDVMALQWLASSTE
ncbi:hypothetical protein Poli38472_008912 [Pythium oligandrum]|uniref:Amino acid transporter n=1 Tax=Pythium oligandrum TaxID=41045 RepID=A0A8K1FCW5_PYTOL|nr:hypothetical protein Poli38472_008912 [Pythium oligandrum]|eukprot:TMW56264.1 hypothetical protein Poli38472_008912 [Pythium oligandrum]